MDLRRDLRRVPLFVLLLGGSAFADGGSAFDLSPGTRVLPPLRYAQLALFPVVQATTNAADRTQYLTLAEGLQKKLIAVAEEQRGAQVNRVTVTNRSDRPLLLLGGEIILGGQQDRIIGKDTILPAHEHASLEVFCVEHGRWSGRREFTSAGGLVESKVRMRAKYRSDQGAVWQEVAKKTAALKAETPTGTYRALATGDQGKRATKPFRDALAPALAKLPNGKDVVGLIAAVNGRVTSVDLFANPALFSAYQDRLLDSIFVSAADVAATPAAEKPPSPTDIRSFMDQASVAPDEEVTASRSARTVEKKGHGVLNSKVLPRAPGAKAAYDSYQADE